MTTIKVSRVLSRIMQQAKQIDLGTTAIYKAIALVCGLVTNLGAVALLTQKFGVSEYAAYALIASFLFLLPFADLGLGAGVVNAVSDLKSKAIDQPVASNVIARSQIILALIGATLLALTAISLLSGTLAIALGSLASVEAIIPATVYTLAAFAIALPFGLGARILQGLGKVRLIVVLGIANPVLNMIWLAVAYASNADIVYYLLAPATSYFTVTILTYFVAVKVAGVRKIPLFQSLLPGATECFPLARTALPFCVISSGLAVGYQSHRLLIAHFGDAGDVASYSLVAQFAAPISALLSTAGQNLWSKYRSTGVSATTLTVFLYDTLIFGVLGLAGAAILAIAVFAANSLLAQGAIHLSPVLLWAAVVYIVVTALQQPGGMFLTSPRGLTQQAFMVIAVGLVSFAGIVYLFPVFSAAAAYLSYALAIVAFQLVPTWHIVYRALAKRSPVAIQKLSI